MPGKAGRLARGLALGIAWATAVSAAWALLGEDGAAAVARLAQSPRARQETRDARKKRIHEHRFAAAAAAVTARYGEGRPQ